MISHSTAPLSVKGFSIDTPSSALIHFLILFTAFIFSTHPSHSNSLYEESLITSIRDIQTANIDGSIENLNRLVKNYPNSKLGHLLLADLLASRGGSRKLIDKHIADQDQLTGLRDEILHRWQNEFLENPPQSGFIPSNLIQTSPAQQYAIVIDASKARLFVYENRGQDYELVENFYMTVGKMGMGKFKEGDLRTPIGVYNITSYIPGVTLPPRYGTGAYPINYPNEFDILNKRTGYGIWIHGTEPGNYNRVPWASDGCVSLSNDEFIDIQKYVDIENTPVIIAKQFNWIPPDEITTQRLKFKKLLDNWISDWESLDNDRYLSHYSKTNFQTHGHDYLSWADYKRRVNRSKRYIKIGISNLSIFAYPGESEMVEISFDQEYASDNYLSVSAKKQYWKKEKDGTWKIIYEG